MTRYELQINDCFCYEVAASLDQAIAQAKSKMTKTELRWAHIIPTGRDIANY